MKYSWIFVIIGGMFFASCGDKGGAGKTPSGFRYEHHVKKDGAKPQIGEYAYFHVTMRNPTTGEVTFDSRNNPQIPRVAIPDPASTPPGQPASPYIEGLALMAIGDSLSVYQSLDSLPRKPQGFDNATEIAFDMVMVDIKSAEEFNKEMEEEQKKIAAERERLTAQIPMIDSLMRVNAAAYTAGKLTDKIQTTDSGLKYIIHEEGTGPIAQNGEVVKAQYYGTLTDGTMFDNSFQRGQSFQFPVGQGRVIKGWDEGFGMLKEGTKATLIIPAELGYGAAGSPPKIPANSELMFYVEIEKVGN